MINQRKMGVILSYISEAIAVLTGLIYTPIMLRLLGQSEYGLYQLVYSVISYLSLLSLGFSGTYIRFYSRYKVKNDQKNIAKLNGMFMTIFGIIAIICIVSGLTLAFNVKFVFGDGLSQSELDTARILMVIITFNMALTFITTVFSCIVTTHEQFVFQKALLICKEICSPFITLPLLFMGYGSIGMVSVTTCLSVITVSINMLFCIKKLKVKFLFRQFDFLLLKEMWVFTFFIFLNQIIDQINWSVDKFLLGRFVGTTAVAVYGIAAQINTMYLRFSTSISNVFAPKINLMVAKQDNDDSALTDLMTRVGRIQMIVLMLVFSGFMFFGKTFVKLWAGNGYFDAYYITLLLILPVTIPLIQNLGIDIQRAKNKHQARSIVYFFIAILNLFISIPFVKMWGAVGAAIGTTLTMLLGNGVFMNLYYHFAIGLDMFYFWKKIVSLLPAVILPAIFGIIMNLVFSSETWLVLSVEIVLYTEIYLLSMWKFGMNAYEKSLLEKPLKKLLRKA